MGALSSLMGGGRAAPPGGAACMPRQENSPPSALCKPSALQGCIPLCGPAQRNGRRRAHLTTQRKFFPSLPGPAKGPERRAPVWPGLCASQPAPAEHQPRQRSRPPSASFLPCRTAWPLCGPPKEWTPPRAPHHAAEILPFPARPRQRPGKKGAGMAGAVRLTACPCGTSAMPAQWKGRRPAG